MDNVNGVILKITITDEITGIMGTGTVVLIEPDAELPGLDWIYCVSDNEEMNTQFEPKLNMMIWRVITSDSNYYSIEEVDLDEEV